MSVVNCFRTTLPSKTSQNKTTDLFFSYSKRMNVTALYIK